MRAAVSGRRHRRESRRRVRYLLLLLLFVVVPIFILLLLVLLAIFVLLIFRFSFFLDLVLLEDVRRELVLRGAYAVRTASNSKEKPPTTSSDGRESRRWREGASTQQDAEIAPACRTARAPRTRGSCGR